MLFAIAVEFIGAFTFITLFIFITVFVFIALFIFIAYSYLLFLLADSPVRYLEI